MYNFISKPQIKLLCPFRLRALKSDTKTSDHLAAVKSLKDQQQNAATRVQSCQ